jgi:hypothetical protein
VSLEGSKEVLRGDGAGGSSLDVPQTHKGFLLKGIDASNSVSVVGRLIEGLYGDAALPDFMVEKTSRGTSSAPIFKVALPADAAISFPYLWQSGVRVELGFELLSLEGQALPQSSGHQLDHQLQGSVNMQEKAHTSSLSPVVVIAAQEPDVNFLCQPKLDILLSMQNDGEIVDGLTQTPAADQPVICSSPVKGDVVVDSVDDDLNSTIKNSTHSFLGESPAKGASPQ